MGPTHRLGGVAAWLAVTTAAPGLPVTPWQVAVGALIAGATANGRMSPDADQSYYVTGKLIPGGHRQVTHWWPWPLLMVAAGLALAQPYGWALLATGVAWASHVVLDGVFGAVPTLPARRRGWEYAGLRLKTGGMIERMVVMPLMAVAVVGLACWVAWQRARGTV